MIRRFVFLLLVTSCCADSNLTCTCCQKEVSATYLDIAMDVIEKAKSNFLTCDNCEHNLRYVAVDCADILQINQGAQSGVYTISPMNRLTMGKYISVYCDMETDGGGWTVIQRRGDYNKPKDYFFKDWKSYKEGFGSIYEDFWLGNDNIFALTNQKLYSARFDLTDLENNTRYATYNNFWIDDENNKYTLHISDYYGNAGDSMSEWHDNQKFSTKDQDNDIGKDRSCAEIYKGAWWYRNCHKAHLNGLYHKGKHSTEDGVTWITWKGTRESLLATEIKIRPQNFSL